MHKWVKASIEYIDNIDSQTKERATVLGYQISGTFLVITIDLIALINSKIGHS